MFRIIALKQRKFSQSDPVLILPKLASVLIQSDPVLIRAHLWRLRLLREWFLHFSSTLTLAPFILVAV